jgi:hypothetical protein
MLRPSIWMRKVECPIQVMRGDSLLARSDSGSLGVNGCATALGGAVRVTNQRRKSRMPGLLWA